MKEYRKVVLKSFKEMIKFKRYKCFSVPFRVLVFILISPFILCSFIFSGVYSILMFVLRFIRVPSEYLKQTMDEHQVSQAPTFIIYLVAYPFKFFIDLFASIIMSFIYLAFFLFEVFTYIGSLGGIKFQPFYFEAKENDIEKEDINGKLGTKNEIIISSIIMILIIAYFIFFVIIPTQISNNEIAEVTANGVSVYVEENGIENGYYIVDAYFFDDGNEQYSIVLVNHGGNSYYIEITFATRTDGTYFPRYIISSSSFEFDKLEYQFNNNSEIVDKLSVDKITSYIEE